MKGSRLEELVADWKDALQLTNAYYGLYKQQRARVDSYESQLRELVQVEPLSTKDWTLLRQATEPTNPPPPTNQEETI